MANDVWVCLLFSIILTSAYTESVPCNQKYVAENGYSCFPCSPGYYRFSDCVRDGEQARCMPCPQNTFQPDCTTSNSCAPCKTCQSRQVRVTTCSDTRNTVCECQNGTFWVQDEFKTDEGFCKDHRQCPPGQGLDRKGSAYSDTKCVDCIQGKSFSNVSSFEKCKVCTRCNATYESGCTKTLDSVCSGAYMVERAHAPDLLVLVYILVPVALVLAVVAVIIVLYKRYKNSDISDEQKQNLSATEQRGSGNTEANSFSGPYVNTGAMSTTGSSIAHTSNENQEMMTQKVNTNGISRKEATGSRREYLNQTQTTENTEEPLGISNSLSVDADRVLPRDPLSCDDAHLQFGNNKQNNRAQATTHSTGPKRGSQKTAADNSTVSFGDRPANVMTDPKIKTGQRLSGQAAEQNSTSMDVVGVPPEDEPAQSFNEQVQVLHGVQSNSEEHLIMNLKDLYCSNAERVLRDIPQLVTGLQSSCHDQYVSGSQEQDETFHAFRQRQIFDEISQPETSSTAGDDRQQISNDDRNDGRTWSVISNFINDLEFNNFKRFFRCLVVMMNIRNYDCDTDIDNTLTDFKTCRETMHQLMRKLRQVAPSCSPQVVLEALEKCNYRKEREELTRRLQ